MNELKCKRCGTDESRIDGFCSIECRDAFDYEEEIAELQDANTELHSRIAELEEKQRWIPVSERLPEGETVLALWKDKTIHLDWTFIDGGSYYWWNSGQANVTHWMPLPVLPEVTE